MDDVKALYENTYMMRNALLVEKKQGESVTNGAFTSPHRLLQIHACMLGGPYQQSIFPQICILNLDLTFNCGEWTKGVTHPTLHQATRQLRTPLLKTHFKPSPIVIYITHVKHT